MFDLPDAGEINQAAMHVLAVCSEPLVKARLQREVRLLPTGPADVSQAPQVTPISAVQQPDGSWGRFHSRDSAHPGPVLTSEWAIQRLLALGLDQEADPLRRATAFMAGVLRGECQWSDPAEKNPRWPLVMSTITAGTLACVSPYHLALDELHSAWLAAAEHIFSGGVYHLQREVEALRELSSGVLFGPQFFLMKNKYTLWLLSARPECLSADLDAAIVRWAWERREGLGYMGVPLATRPASLTATRLELWLQSLETLARFRSFREAAGPALAWLWAQCRPDGLWDLGPRDPQGYYFPLSVDWRHPLQRKVDWSTRVLVLLAKGCR